MGLGLMLFCVIFNSTNSLSRIAIVFEPLVFNIVSPHTSSTTKHPFALYENSSSTPTPTQNPSTSAITHVAQPKTVTDIAWYLES